MKMERVIFSIETKNIINGALEAYSHVGDESASNPPAEPYYGPMAHRERRNNPSQQYLLPTGA
jgi:hypothetical protein